MARRRKLWSAALAGALALAVAAAAGVAWSQVAGAGRTAPRAALAPSGTVAASSSVRLAAQGERSSIRGTQLTVSRGSSAGRRATIGGGDEVIAALTGSLAPVAVDSSDGNTIVYAAWRQLSSPRRSDPARGVRGQGLEVGDPIGIPTIRSYDAVTGRDRLVESGAYAPALSRDGRLAFVRGDANVVRQNVAYTGRIVVGSVDDRSRETWTSESARWFPYAWAGSTLLAYKALPDSEAADLYALTGPGEARLLAPEAFAIALSPNGSRVLVTVGRRMVEVVRVGDGAIEASLPLDDSAADAPHALMFSGSWLGDRVVATSDVGLVVLDVRDGIRIESVLDTSAFPNGLAEPTLLSDHELAAWADVGARPGPEATDEPAYDNALVECDLAARSCAVAASSPARTWTRWVVNPSR